MLPRLQAEERLTAIMDGQVAFGLAEKDVRRETFQLLEKAIGLAPAKPRKATPAVLGAMGIGVRSPLAPPKEAPPLKKVLGDG